MEKRDDTGYRRRFAELISQIQIGDSLTDVHRQLGGPDSAVESDVFFMSHPRFQYVAQVWLYGVSGTDVFPTLGQVWLGHDQTVVHVVGGGVVDSELAAVEEPELRWFLRVFARGPALTGEHFDPLLTIQCVNRLQRIGKSLALSIVREYMRISGADHVVGEAAVALILRILFESSNHPSILPSAAFGTPTPNPPADQSILRRYPLELILDIPLNLTTRISPALSTGVYDIKPLIAYYQDHGIVRPSPLSPAANPFIALKEFISFPLWNSGNWLTKPGEREQLLRALIRQVFTLSRSVYQENQILNTNLSWSDLIAVLDQACFAFQTRPVKWVGNLDDYRFQ